MSLRLISLPFVRGEKTTKPIGEDELSRLKNPEERSTTALDPKELAKLVDRSAIRAGTEDDLAIPVETAPVPEPLPMWTDATKESAVIVSTPPEADPAPPVTPPRTRSREHVQRMKTPALGVIHVEAPHGHRALTKPPEVERRDETPTRMPRGSTRQATLDEVAHMRSANKRSLLIALALGAPCALLAVVYLLIR